MRSKSGFFTAICLVGASVLFSGTAFAQQHNPIPVAVPSLQIAPDARGGGMGDIGAATMPDLYSQYWNAAKYPFISGTSGFSVAYTPWLSRLVNDIDLVYLSGFWKFGNDNLNAISASFRYFSLGDVEVFDQNTDFVMAVSPHEYAMDVAYSRRLSETFSGAVTLRYIRATTQREMTTRRQVTHSLRIYQATMSPISILDAPKHCWDLVLISRT